jgi:hypothetical protein
VGSTGGTVQVQPVNGCGQGLPATLAVTVGNAPLQGSITGLDTVCANGPGSLQFVLANASGADTIVWAVSNGWNIVSGQGTDTLLVSTGHSAGVVTVNTSNNCGASQPVSLNVAVLDTLPLAITQSNDTMYASTGGVTYHWFENGSPVAGATTPVLAGNHTGTFSVSVVNAAGCVSASQPYNFVFVSVNNILFESMVNIYPNPATGSFHVAVPASFVGGKIKIYDMQGKVVMLSAITNAQTDFAAQNFNKGIYLVEVEAGMGTLRKKLVLQ